MLIEGSEETCTDCTNSSQKLLEIKSKFIERNGKFPYKLYRFNAQLNSVPAWVFEKIPQLIFIRKNKKIATFIEDIEVNNVIEFIEDNLSSDNRDSWREDL